MIDLSSLKSKKLILYIKCSETFNALPIELQEEKVSKISSLSTAQEQEEIYADFFKEENKQEEIRKEEKRSRRLQAIDLLIEKIEEMDKIVRKLEQEDQQKAAEKSEEKLESELLENL